MGPLFHKEKPTYETEDKKWRFWTQTIITNTVTKMKTEIKLNRSTQARDKREPAKPTAPFLRQGRTLRNPMPCPSPDMEEENLRPIVAIDTDHLLVPKTVYVLVVMVTHRSELPANNIRQCFSLDPVLCFLFELPDLDASAYPVAPDSSHHVQCLLLGVTH